MLLCEETPWGNIEVWQNENITLPLSSRSKSNTKPAGYGAKRKIIVAVYSCNDEFFTISGSASIHSDLGLEVVASFTF